MDHRSVVHRALAACHSAFSTSSNGEDFGEIYSGQTANYEKAAGLTPFTGGNRPNYNVQTAGLCAGTSGNTGLNIFANPCTVYNEFRRPVLGLDTNSGGAGSHPRLRVLEPRRHHLQGLQSYRANRRHAVLPVREHLEPLRPGRPDHQHRFRQHVRRRDQPVHYSRMARSAARWSLGCGCASNYLGLPSNLEEQLPPVHPIEQRPVHQQHGDPAHERLVSRARKREAVRAQVDRGTNPV